ncbi:MAG: hypothetical protein OXC10_10155 [Rhodospirillaceae bacterium]|nr:hypothetical protein [Rhodospirillaceae bacterium]
MAELQGKLSEEAVGYRKYAETASDLASGGAWSSFDFEEARRFSTPDFVDPDLPP